jgi:hypothetical protein
MLDTTISTRRLRARPSAVELSAIGDDQLRPSTSIAFDVVLEVRVGGFSFVGLDANSSPRGAESS